MARVLWPMSRLELLARASVVFWAVLFLGTTWGHWHMTRSDAFSGQIAREVRTWESLIDYTHGLVPNDNWAKATDREKVQAMFGALQQRFGKSTAEYDLAKNWIMWGLGLIYKEAGRIHLPEVLLRNERRIDSAAFSHLLMLLATDNGFDARMVDLGGYVVTEIFLDGRWQMFDAFGNVGSNIATSRVKDPTPFAVQDLEENAKMREKLYKGTPYERVADLLDKQDSHHIGMNGNYFDPKISTLQVYEEFANWLKFVIPVVAIALSVMLTQTFKRLGYQERKPKPPRGAVKRKPKPE